MVLREPVHIFSIPQNIINTLSSRLGPQISHPEPVDATPQPPEVSDPSSSLSCALCLGAAFPSLKEQRNHFRSDWHRYNVKARLQDANSQPVSEPEFSELVQALEDSLSGSASSSSEEDSDDDAVAALLEKHEKHHINDELIDEETSLPRSPITWFQSPDAQNTQLGVYNVIFPSSIPPEEYAIVLSGMQDGGPTGRSWALFMTAGGHFAGMIARVSKPGITRDIVQPIPITGKKPKGDKPVSDLEIIAHKTFHRYTTRRKQGGSQSVNDNAKGPAKSAGALLRRYGEQALRDDIRALLVEWTDELQSCERIFIRANASNRRIFLDFDESPIPKGDNRLRTFPFQTRRPTLSELTRCLRELTRAKITHLTEDEVRAADEAFLAFLQSKRKTQPSKPTSRKEAPDAEKKKPVDKISPEELAIRERWSKLLEMIRKGRLESLKTQWELIRSPSELNLAPLVPRSSVQESYHPPLVDTRLPAWVQEEDGVGVGGTLLQVATAAGQEAIVQWLLVDQHADPTIPVPTSLTLMHASSPANSAPPAASEDEDEASRPRKLAGGMRKAYDLASKKNVRNVFRRAAYTDPDWWDWLGDAHVPSVLSPEMEEAEQRKKGVRRKGLKERMKEREDAKKAEEERQEKERLAAASSSRGTTPVPPASGQNKTGPRRLGGTGPMSGASATTLDAMPPEMRARVERERRARAAEARLRNLGGGGASH